MFTVIIGSVSRNDYKINSDIDICRVGMDTIVFRNSNWPTGPINYVDYEVTDFLKLYEAGSLFLHHIFKEGVLVCGNRDVWDGLKKGFLVQESFDDEIKNVIAPYQTIRNIKMFGGCYLSLYSNLFTIVKNYAMFSLANEGQYVFDKTAAMEKIFSSYYNELLNDSYNYFERGIANDKWDYNNESLAKDAIDYYYSKIMEEYHG